MITVGTFAIFPIIFGFSGVATWFWCLNKKKQRKGLLKKAKDGKSESKANYNYKPKINWNVETFSSLLEMCAEADNWHAVEPFPFVKTILIK